MVTSLNVDTALLQEALELDREVPIQTLVEIALREYIQHRKQMKKSELSFGESLSAFRQKQDLRNASRCRGNHGGIAPTKHYLWTSARSHL